MRRFAIGIKPGPENGGLVATVPSLPGVVGQGETEDEALEDVRAALLALQSMAERGEKLPPGGEVTRELELAV